MTHALFDPLTLRDTTIRNRIWIPPMCQYSAEKQDGVPTSWHLMHYGSFARGGAGLVTVEATAVVPEGRITPQCLGIWNDEQARAFAPMTELIHSQGAKAAIQLAHAGRKASTWREWPGEAGGTGARPGSRSGSVSVEDGGWQTVAPSAVAFGDLAEPRELTVAEIGELVQAFARAARRAVDAGFDVLEIHGAHGYLVHEFLSPASNMRSDEYGGDMVGRARFLLQIIDAVRAEVGESMPIIVRLSGTEWAPEGYSMEEIIDLSKWLGTHGVDFLSISTGGNISGAGIAVGPGYQVPTAETIREGSHMPVGAVGVIVDPAQAEQIVALGQADVVYLGRESLRDPNFPIRAARALGFDEPYIPPQYARAF
ncbi:MAG: NADH:flavin oxidoreductase/NADH oxidase [Ancrocorticia sp.]|uniref:NADH:flavin oxidoreductase/NADH oxidase n=1 Tax=Ancrocorticia sp. TaxID=2593684 RepID=UPI003F8F1DA1